MKTNRSLQKVLVPLAVERSAESLLLLSYAGQFAAVFGAELLLLQTTTTPLIYTERYRIIKLLRAMGERVLGRLSKDKSYVPFKCLVRQSKLKESVQAVVQETSVDLVLLQAEAYPDGGRVGAADHAAAVMEQVSCPVMIVPIAQPFRTPQRLVFATDFTDADPEVLAQINHFAALAGAALTLVQVYSKAEQGQLSQLKAAMPAVEKQLTALKVSLQLLEAEDVLEGISNFAEREQADMVLLATHDSFLMQRLFSEAYVKKNAYHTHIPLLTYRQYKKKACAGCHSCSNCSPGS